ncbi:MAG: hypothetical protein ACLFWL_10930 [Candidatus Brocadiia bacterium]
MAQFDVQVTCPACGATFKVARIRRGASEKCPVCQADVEVGDGDTYNEDRQEAVGFEEESVGASSGDFSRPLKPAGATGKYYVCVRDERKVNPIAASEVLCELTETPDVEVKMQITRGQGILAKDLTESAAEVAVRRLKALDIDAFAVDVGYVPEIDRLPVSRFYGISPEAVQFQTDERGTVRSVPPEAVIAGFCAKVQMIGGGPTQLRVSHGGEIDGVYFERSHRRFKAVEREKSSGVQCTLLVSGKSGNLYSARFDENKVRYRYLESRCKMSVSQNLKALWADLVKICRGAFFPAGTRNLAEGSINKVTKLKQDDDYYSLLDWVLCCLAKRHEQREL